MLAAEMATGNLERVKSDALAQVAAGAHILDVNAGIPLIDEPAVLKEVVKLVQSITDVPLCIDSSVIDALRSGLEAYQGKALVNSVTGEEDRMETVLPLVKKHGAAVIALCNDESGISDDPDVRFAVAKKIVERAMDYGIAKEDVLIDPLVMPIGAKQFAGKQVFHIVRRVSTELGCNTICGASNVSFGLPNRHALNAAFVAMLIASGMTAAITNPLESNIKGGIMAADALMGNDENCMNWIAANRQIDPNARRGGRRRSRRAG